MSTTHPSDLELFEYVEGELDGPSAARIQLHVDGCPICAAAIAESGRGRDALRASPVLELPDSARQTLRDQLGEQEPAPERPRRWSPGRLAAFVAPIAAVAVAAVVAVVVVTGNDDKAQKVQPGGCAGDRCGRGNGTFCRCVRRGNDSCCGDGGRGQLVRHRVDRGTRPRPEGLGPSG